jgi:hypothetical protein
MAVKLQRSECSQCWRICIGMYVFYDDPPGAQFFGSLYDSAQYIFRGVIFHFALRKKLPIE